MALMLNSPKLIQRNIPHDVNVLARSLSNESREKDSNSQKAGDAKASDNQAFQMDTTEMTERALNNDSDTTVPKDNEIVTESNKACSNSEWRRKVLKTVFLLFAYSTAGMLYSQFGPTLPDLQKISGVDLEKASWIFTGFAVGYLIGCLLGGFLLEKFNEYLMVFLYTFGNAVVTALLPWIPEFYVMLANRVVIGIFIGGQDTAAHTLLLQIWVDQGGRFIHLTHILAATGGTLAPLITEPFVLPLETEQTSVLDWNDTFRVSENGSLIRVGNESRMSSDVTTESNIHYAFLITALISAVASFPVLYIFISEKRHKLTTDTDTEDNSPVVDLQSKGKYSILVILNVVSFLATACTDLFPSFLTTFLIEQLGWEQSTGTILTALYFSMYGFGNLISAFIYNKISTTFLITLSMTSTVISTTLLLMGVILNQSVVIWISVALIGLSIAATLPALFTWTQIKVTPVTGRIASAYLFSGSAGVMANPLIMGFFMDNFTPMWFIYFSLGQPSLCLILFSIAYSLQKFYSSRLDTCSKDNEENQCQNIDNMNGKDKHGKDERRYTKEIYIDHL